MNCVLEPTVPSDLYIPTEQAIVAMRVLTSYLNASPCYDAMLMPGGDLAFIDSSGELCGGITRELQQHFGGNA